jgi:hypothetical protein
MYGAEAVVPEEVKHRTLWTAIEAPVCPSEAKEKDLLVPDKHRPVANLQKYQEETKAWRDPKIKLQELNVGNLVLLRSPHTGSTSKLEDKWARSYVVIEKSKSGTYCLSDSQGTVLEHYRNAENLRHFFVWIKLINGGLVNYKQAFMVVVASHIYF